jgi:hypothetical protein
LSVGLTRYSRRWVVAEAAMRQEAIFPISFSRATVVETGSILSP